MQRWLNDWPCGVRRDWRQIIGNVTPDFEAIRCTTRIHSDQCVYPRRYPHSTGLPDAPEGSHIFHALSNLSPSDTRVVLIGQDPYTASSRATGRSFEAGDKDTWDRVGNIPSLRRICQQLAAKRTGNQEYRCAKSWKSLRRDIANGTVPMPCISQHFDHWERQGVLLLNRSLTATSRQGGMSGAHPHLCDHLAMWKPIVSTICSYLVENNHVVFVLLGSEAKRVFGSLPNLPPNASTVCRYHPGFTDRHAPAGRNVPFLKGQNLFDEIDEKLPRSHNRMIDW